MKTFKQFLKEQQEEPWNSRGILRVGDKIFVGVEHGVTPRLDPKMHDEIQQHMDKHGYWHEGNEGDAQALEKITKGKKYNGSYDEKLINGKLYVDEKGQRFTPHYHMSNLFGNLPGGPQEKQLAQSLSHDKLNIKDAIVKNQGKVFGAPIRNPDEFFNQLPKNHQKFLNLPATPENMLNFVQNGAADTWQDNKNPDTSLGNMARKTQTERENHLLNKAPPGVYYIGSGHISSMVNTLKTTNIPHSLVGGTHAHL